MRQPIPHPDFPPGVDPPGPRPARAPGSGARIWLVRHAEVHADFEGTAYGNSDVPLSKTGEEQTRVLGARFAALPLELVRASPLARATAMGRAIAVGARAPLELAPGLAEVDRGAWQGLPTAEFRARWLADREAFLADPWRWKGHGGESDADLFARGWPVLYATLEAARGGTVVLASHYNLIRALVTGALGLGARASFAFRNRPAHAALLVDAPGGFELRASDVDDPRGVG
ncbi:MAG: histidine phosphatase family protein [Planctomycetes bacterium]|nr:histidine phosphatase family protein [Planctomycetota bacterium]